MLGEESRLFEEVGEDEREDGHQLHQDVERGSAGVLQRVADSVAHNGRLFSIRYLVLLCALHFLGLVELLGVVPGAARVRGGDGQLHGGDQRAGQEAGHGLDAEQESEDEGREDDLRLLLFI